jgi:diketogulonate reductase-like aldo/keto reductase
MTNVTTQRVILSNGLTMPQLGLGVWQAKDGKEVQTAVQVALEAGYRLIDTASIYGNEAGVGQAVAASAVPREELFITTKVWNSDQGYDQTLRAYETSAKKLGVDYVDLYLIHWPMPKVGKFKDTWRALERLYNERRARAIGVANFKPQHLDQLLATASIPPMVNQIELHPRLTQKATRDYCRRHKIVVESYSPLMRGGELLRDRVITKIAATHAKTAAQVVLRWHLQHKLVVIPKSVTPERIRDNADIFDFELTREEMSRIDHLNQDTRSGMDPDDMNVQNPF